MRSLPWLLACVSAIVTAASCGSVTRTGLSGGTGAADASGGAGGAPSATGAGNAGNNGGSTGALTLIDGGTGTGGGGTCAAYKSCQDLGFNCGMAPDGCGNVQDCGTCAAPNTCAGGGTQNVFGMPVCTKQTCTSQGFDCGMASDTCGGTLDCGTCATGQTCGAQSPDVCGTGTCMEMTCAQQGYDCGMQGDGCGNTVDCGTCPANQACGGGANPKNGVCGTTTCVPKTCANQGFNCGMATDGCGNVIDCSMGMTCPGGEICGGGGPNVCGGNGCAVGTELVYVWALDGNIYSFDPPTKTFTFVATPDCDAFSPNSMAIDRNLNAWLNYLEPGGSAPNDYIYKFNLTTKTGCQASGIQIPAGFDQVGMGFSSDTPGGSTETLYVDGIGGAGLAKVNMTNKTITSIGNFANDANLEGQSCELTGTGNALLFGYFTTSPYVRVAQLDKTNANATLGHAAPGLHAAGRLGVLVLGRQLLPLRVPQREQLAEQQRHPVEPQHQRGEPRRTCAQRRVHDHRRGGLHLPRHDVHRPQTMRAGERPVRPGDRRVRQHHHVRLVPGRAGVHRRRVHVRLHAQDLRARGLHVRHAGRRLRRRHQLRRLPLGQDLQRGSVHQRRLHAQDLRATRLRVRLGRRRVRQHHQLRHLPDGRDLRRDDPGPVREARLHAEDLRTARLQLRRGDRRLRQHHQLRHVPRQPDGRRRRGGQRLRRRSGARRRRHGRSGRAAGRSRGPSVRRPGTVAAHATAGVNRALPGEPAALQISYRPALASLVSIA